MHAKRIIHYLHKIQFKYLKYTCLWLVCLILFQGLLSCNSVKMIPEEKFLLTKYTIDCKDKRIDLSNLESFVKQKPNRKVLFLRFYLYTYNLFKSGKEKKWKNKIAETIGEPPVVYDMIKTKKTTKQFKLYLQNKGYYHASVSDTTYFDVKTRKAKVRYSITAGDPIVIKEITDSIEDPEIEQYFLQDKINSLLKTGINLDVDLLQKERSRFADTLKNKGYYFFKKEYITYMIDTVIDPYSAKLTISINNPAQAHGVYKRSLPHQKYKISDINIYSQYDQRQALNLGKDYFDILDTVEINDYDFIYTNPKKIKPKKIQESKMRVFVRPNVLKIKPNVIFQGLYFSKNSLYNGNNIKDSYNYLSSLRAFKLVNINFEVDSTHIKDTIQSLNCQIQLTRSIVQSFTFEIQGTNSSGNLGTAGNFLYQHNNFFKGAEVFNFKIKGAIEAQKDVLGGSEKNFNTIELGCEARIEIPKFYAPISYKRFKSRTIPKTNFNIGYDYQNRPDYTRTVVDLSYGYIWKTSKSITSYFNPVQFNFVKLPRKTEQFQRFIDSIFITDSYENHVIESANYTLVVNTQNLNKKVNFIYFKWFTEFAGNALAMINKTAGAEKENGSWQLFGNPFAQYFKTDIDYRYYHVFSSKNKLVYRIFGGIAYPYGNLDLLPFGKKYFSGGANSIRGWQVRSLGPGSYKLINREFINQTGDIKLEGNIEYRFKMFWVVEGAVFVDAGNIWDIKLNDQRPEGLFKLNRFYKEIAVGSGLGFRFDFSFLILRFDFGIKMYDPAEDENKRWIIAKRHLDFKNDFALNVGINYPF